MENTGRISKILSILRAYPESNPPCLCFFNSRDEQNKVLMPFFKEGMDRGEKIFHIVDGRLREDHLRACREADSMWTKH
jgi:hypothetical protein